MTKTMADNDSHVISLVEDHAPRIVMNTMASVTPSSYHQAAVYVWSSESSVVSKCWVAAISMLIVIFQCGIAGGLLFSTAAPLCTSNSNCPRGFWCPGDYKGIDRCQACDNSYSGFCEGAGPLELQALWDENAGNFFSKPGELDRNLLCDACISEDASGRSYVNWKDAQEKNIKVMGVLDWFIFVFTVVLVTYVVVHETRDLVLCRMATVAAEVRCVSSLCRCRDGLC